MVVDCEAVLARAAACFQNDFDACIAHLRMSVGHHRATGTTNPLERLFVEAGGWRPAPVSALTVSLRAGPGPAAFLCSAFVAPSSRVGAAARPRRRRLPVATRDGFDTAGKISYTPCGGALRPRAARLPVSDQLGGCRGPGCTRRSFAVGTS